VHRPYTSAGGLTPVRSVVDYVRHCQAQVLFTRAGFKLISIRGQTHWRRISEILVKHSLLLPRSLPSRNKQDLPSGCRRRTTEARPRIILAGRYRFCKKIGEGIFKAHDLALDQTVIVRGPFRSRKGHGDLWRKKARQLALVRNPHFLNVLDVISEKSGDFLVSEQSRGKSVAGLLGERSRFDVEAVLTLMISLASALDLAASFTWSPRSISARYLFAESKHWIAVDPEESSFSELAQLCVRLDVSELVTPIINAGPSCLISKPLRRGFKGLAVRQAALLTYELLGGDPEDGNAVERRFKPIGDLSKSSNAILYYGLLGSPGCRTSESFMQKLAEARRCGSSKAEMWSVPALHTSEDCALNARTNDVLKRFNRETKRLVAGILGLVTFGALAFAVLVPERQLKMVDLTEASSPSKPGSLFNAAFPMLFGKEKMNANSIIGGQLPVRERLVNPGWSGLSPAENLEPIKPVAAQTPNPVLVLNSQINQLHEQPNGSKWSLEPKDSAPAIRILISHKRHKPLDRPNVKMRLLTLWHRSLARNIPHGWKLFSVKGGEDKGGYAAHASP
jgi:hypothetical protein